MKSDLITIIPTFLQIVGVQTIGDHLSLAACFGPTKDAGNVLTKKAYRAEIPTFMGLIG